MITKERTVKPLEWPAVEPVEARPDASSTAPARDTGADVYGVPCSRPGYVVAKRILDIPLAVLALLLAAPVMLMVALLIRLRSPGPVLFKHMRLGRNGELFGCLKFRTMHVDAEQRLRGDPELWAEFVANGYKLHPDPRVIPLGAFLRKSSLDELPQLLNVLKGEMSLVGPRPIIEPELTEYGDRAEVFLTALPGMTGRWQASGDEQVAYPGRTDVELGYIYDWSLWEDLKILCRTVPVVLRACASRFVRA